MGRPYRTTNLNFLRNPGRRRPRPSLPWAEMFDPFGVPSQWESVTRRLDLECACFIRCVADSDPEPVAADAIPHSSGNGDP